MGNTELEVPTNFLNGDTLFAVGYKDLELRISPETLTGILAVGSISIWTVIKALGVAEKEHLKGEEKST